MAKGIQGTVEVQVKLDAAGNVDDASIVSGPEELRKGVLQSVLNWHFAHDSANSTRQVSVAFQLPQGTPQAPTASGAQPTVLKKIMISALSDQQRARLLAQLPVHEGDALDAGKLSNLSHVLGTFDERLAYIIGDDGTLAIRGGGGSWESKDPRLQGPDQPTVVKTITIAGLSDRQRDELLAQLPVHEGDTLDPRAVLALFKTVRTFDEHLSLVLPGDGSVRIAPQPPGPTAPPPPPPPPPPPGAIQSNSQAIRVGREVQQANLVTQVVPVYPLDAKVARVQGTVSFEAAIGKDGTVQNLHLISGPPLLANAALQAVQQWVYRPTLLNGSPIEVITTIDVHFTLSK
jgi:TonB family protein